MVVWIVLVGTSYFVDSKKLYPVAEFLAVSLPFALIIMAWATAKGAELGR